jgi:hypothetical protein
MLGCLFRLVVAVGAKQLLLWAWQEVELQASCPYGRHVTMDKGTLKTPITKCRLYLSFLFGVVKQFCWF